MELFKRLSYCYVSYPVMFIVSIQFGPHRTTSFLTPKSKNIRHINRLPSRCHISSISDVMRHCSRGKKSNPDPWWRCGSISGVNLFALWTPGLRRQPRFLNPCCCGLQSVKVRECLVPLKSSHGSLTWRLLRNQVTFLLKWGSKHFIFCLLKA